MEEPELEHEHEPEPELSLATSVLPRSMRRQDWRFISQTLQEQRDAVQAAHEGVS